MKLNTLMENGFSALIVGPPGCAKTARVLAAARETGRRPVIMRASLSERLDFGGALIPDLAAGITRLLPMETLRDLRTTTEPTLLFLDDLGQAPMDVQAALMSLFDEGNLSPEVLIWGATNRPGDKAGVSALCEPLRSRFDSSFAVPTPGTRDEPSGPVMLGTWEETVQGWCDWVSEAYPAAYEVAAWHRSPGLGAESSVGPVLYGWQSNADPALRMPDFRTWRTVARYLTAGIRDFGAIASAIGKGQAAAFLAFCELAGEIPDPAQVWMDPAGAPLPSSAGALCLTAQRLAGSVEPRFAGQFVRYIDRMPQVFAAFSAMAAYKRLNAALSGNREWQQWFTRNSALFAQG